jgi:hypothetical protein
MFVANFLLEAKMYCINNTVLWWAYNSLWEVEHHTLKLSKKFIASFLLEAKMYSSGRRTVL